MTDIVTPTVVISRAGAVALRLERFEERGEVFDRDALGLAYRAMLAPGAHPSRLIVLLDPLIERDPVSWGYKQLEGISPQTAVVQLGAAAIAGHLDTLSVGEEQSLREVVCWSEALERLAKTARASDDQILHYIKAKVFWAWKYDLTVATFDLFDGLVLGVPLDTIHRVALAATDHYLRQTRAPSGAVLYEALPRLLREYPRAFGTGAGVAPGDLLQRLAAPRYLGPATHLEKAIDFFSDAEPDRPNAVKEAICAVEGLARIVCRQPAATLGDLITELRTSGRLNPALARSLEGLWGFASNAPGARHGAAGPLAVSQEEAQFVLDSARAALSLLLTLDTPSAT